MGLASNELPEELLLIIFLLQPMKTLVLLRTVCKLWHQIISSEYFIQLFLSQQRTSSNTNKYFLLQHASESKCLMDGETLKYRYFFGEKYECYGICDGLFCLSPTNYSKKSHSKILLWNPIFRRKLPPLKKIKYSENTRLFFGYHDDDYKVFKFVFFSRRYYVCIYSLSTNDWKVLEYVDDPISRIIHLYPNARLVNGSAYFVEAYIKSDGRMIFFDLSCEKFRKIKIPVNSLFNPNFVIEEYRESVALIGYDTRENVVVMWVLRVTDDNLFSWKKMSVINFEDRWKFDPMGFINKDELVLWRDDSGFLYNIKNECGLELTTREIIAKTVVQSSGNVTYSVTVGVVDGLSDFNGLRMYMMEIIRIPDWKLTRPKTKEVASTCTSNRYNVLADSNSNRYVFPDSDDEDIWSGC